MVRFSKFILNIKIYEKFVEFLSKLVCRVSLQTSLERNFVPKYDPKKILEFKNKKYIKI